MWHLLFISTMVDDALFGLAHSGSYKLIVKPLQWSGNSGGFFQYYET